MRATPPTLVLGVLLLATACGAGGDDTPPDAAADAGPPGEQVFAPGEQITVDLTMYDGEAGRATPFFSGYRPTVAFAHGDQTVACAAQLPVDLREFPAGQTHVIGLECDAEVTVPVDEPEFVLLEDGVERGVGTVVFTDHA